MRISKWVDMGQEVYVEICADDIRAALSEAFECVTYDRLGEPGPMRHDVTSALNHIGAFLNGMADSHIALLTDGQRATIEKYLLNASKRFALQPEVKI